MNTSSPIPASNIELSRSRSPERRTSPPAQVPLALSPQKAFTRLLDSARGESPAMALGSLETAISTSSPSMGDGRNSALQEAAMEFESLLVEHMLRSMRSSMGSTPGSSPALESFRELADQAVARQISLGKRGPASLIHTQVREQHRDGVPPPAATTRELNESPAATSFAADLSEPGQ